MDSSSNPVTATRRDIGHIQRNHRSRKDRIIRNRTTHPQTLPIILTEETTVSERDSFSRGHIEPELSVQGISQAHITEAAIWIAHSAHRVLPEGNTDPSTPKRKDGPGLLQKRSSRWAFFLEMLLLDSICPIAWAPAGYPPRKAGINKDSQPSGILINLPTGRRRGNDTPLKAPVISPDNTKKGNREGIRLRMQSSIPSRAPARAVLPSRIKIPMHTDALIPSQN